MDLKPVQRDFKGYEIVRACDLDYGIELRARNDHVSEMPSFQNTRLVAGPAAARRRVSDLRAWLYLHCANVDRACTLRNLGSFRERME